MNLKILILIRDDITDRKTWSGVPKHIKTILEDSGNQIDFIHKLKLKYLSYASPMHHT